MCVLICVMSGETKGLFKSHPLAIGVASEAKMMVRVGAKALDIFALLIFWHLTARQKNKGDVTIDEIEGALAIAWIARTTVYLFSTLAGLSRGDQGLFAVGGAFLVAAVLDGGISASYMSGFKNLEKRDKQ